MKIGKLFLFVIFCIAAYSTNVFAQTTLIGRGSAWKYLDNGSNQGAAWTAAAFNDSAWASVFPAKNPSRTTFCTSRLSP